MNFLPFDLEKAKAGHRIITRRGKEAKFIGVEYCKIWLQNFVTVEVFSNILNKPMRHKIPLSGKVKANMSLHPNLQEDGLDLFLDPTWTKSTLSNMFNDLSK